MGCLRFSNLWTRENTVSVSVYMKKRWRRERETDMKMSEKGYFCFVFSSCRVIGCRLTICSCVRTSLIFKVFSGVRILKSNPPQNTLTFRVWFLFYHLAASSFAETAFLTAIIQQCPLLVCFWTTLWAGVTGLSLQLCAHLCMSWISPAFSCPVLRCLYSLNLCHSLSWSFSTSLQSILTCFLLLAY